MKKTFFLACLLSICSVSSFAQMPANDSAYPKANPAEVNAASANGRHANGRHANKRHGNKGHGKHHRHIVRKSTK